MFLFLPDHEITTLEEVKDFLDTCGYKTRLSFGRGHGKHVLVRKSARIGVVVEVREDRIVLVTTVPNYLLGFIYKSILFFTIKSKLDRFERKVKIDLEAFLKQL